jgi:site-specific DNA recombinase
MCQKTVRDDYCVRQRNRGNKYQYYFSDHHEAIINREVFDAAQAIITQLAKESGADRSKDADIKQVTDEIYRLCDEKQKTLVENAGRDDLRKRITESSIFLWKQPTIIKEYDDKLVRQLIDKVTIYEDRFEVVFRSGVMVEVNG